MRSSSWYRVSRPPSPEATDSAHGGTRRGWLRSGSAPRADRTVPRAPRPTSDNCRGGLPVGLHSAGVVLRAVVCGFVLAGATAPASWSKAKEPMPSTPAMEDDAKVELKTVMGTVSGIGSGFIAVEFQRDEKRGASLEMALPVEPQAKFQSVASLKSLKLGDTVMVEYQETTSKDSRGDSTRVKRAATAITLIKRAPAPEVAGSSNPEGQPE